MCSKNVNRFLDLLKVVVNAPYNNPMADEDRYISCVSDTMTLTKHFLVGLIYSIFLMILSSKQCVHNRNKTNISTYDVTYHIVKMIKF